MFLKVGTVSYMTIQHFFFFFSSKLFAKIQTTSQKEYLRYYSVYQNIKIFTKSKIYLKHLQFSNVSTDTTVIFKNNMLNEEFTLPLNTSQN